MDWTDIRTFSQDSLMVQVVQVIQEPFLFTDTVMENLKFAREGSTNEDCIATAKQANAHGFIRHTDQILVIDQRTHKDLMSWNLPYYDFI
jgi:ATP-binding cassette subfamily B protein